MKKCDEYCFHSTKCIFSRHKCSASGTVEWKCDMPHGTRADRRSGVVLLRSLARCATVHTPGRAAGRPFPRRAAIADTVTRTPSGADPFTYLVPCTTNIGSPIRGVGEMSQAFTSDHLPVRVNWK